MFSNGATARPYQYQPETTAAILAVPAHVVSGRAARIGADRHEPILIMLDSLLRYARAHEHRFESKLSEDYVLGPVWLDAIRGTHALLDGDGAVAHELGVTTDSKDNGACESLYWSALAVAGFTEADLV